MRTLRVLSWVIVGSFLSCGMTGVHAGQRFAEEAGGDTTPSVAAPLRAESVTRVEEESVTTRSADDAIAPDDGWSDDLRLTVDPGSSQTSINFARSAAAGAGGRVHAVWQDDRTGRSQIFHARSSPQGSRWSHPRRLSKLSAIAAQPAVAASGLDVYVVWHEDVVEGGELKQHVRFVRSQNRGKSWSAPFEVTAGTSGGAHPSVAVSGTHVDVVWGGGEGGFGEVSTRHSSDRGVTWGSIRRVSTTPFHSWVPTIESAGETVWIGWVDYQDANEEEYLSLSSDAGDTWTSPARLTLNGADSWAPTLAFGGDGVLHLTWFDRRDAGLTDFEVEVALDDVLRLLGQEPGPPPPRDPFVYYLPEFDQRIADKLALVDQLAPLWVAQGGDPEALEAGLTTFEERRQTWLDGWEVYYKQSLDGGYTWTPDRRLTVAPRPSARPSIAADGDEIHIVWYDGRDYDEEIYTKHSIDGGMTWSDDERLTLAPGASRYPTVVLTNDWVHVVWYDSRDGNDEIYTKGRRRSP